MKEKKTALFWVLLQGVLTAAFTVGSKMAFNQGVDPLNFSAQILIVAGLILLLILGFQRPGELFKFNPGSLTTIFLAAFFGSGCFYALSFVGIKYSSAVNFGFLSQTCVVFTALLAYFLLKEKLTFYKLGLVLMLLLGCYLVSTGGSLMVPKIGDWLIVLGALAFSLGVIAAKFGMRDVPPLFFSGYRALLGGLFLLAYLVVSGGFRPQIAWGWVLLVGGFVAFAILGINKTLELASASYVVMMSNLIPVFTVILAFLVLGEKMTAPQIIGGAVILASSILCQWREA